MSKTNRLSVPISTSLERQLRQFSAENGRSLAANFAEMAQRGAEKITIEQQLLAIKNNLQSGTGGAEELRKISAQLGLIEKHLSVEKPSAGALPEGVFIPEKPARLLFGEALFSAALSAQIITAEMPGTPQKPAGVHIRIAREKANAQLAELLGGE
ncbi:hypothetical protein GBK02_11235 [Dechloromonas sp. TW-R-39-2]|uniref:hypothetical protein n=1 Tax=Dechloromonas sp. TW-R-39-2 TaxID=2654218 RepID=UPI00193E34CA|nr:hypothetical protein [Dechloromonas sp. TW-R-39-2]QRM19936.1 hypothetical protein GBK02_11235 [Dechloromonas sp. TW-R-39-2]